MFSIMKILSKCLKSGQKSNFCSKYDKIFRSSINPQTREKFWRDEANEILWDQHYSEVLDSSELPYYKWFAKGKVNMSANCIDRHIKSGHGESKAIIWESAYLN